MLGRLVVKDLRMMFRERTFVSIILLLLFVASFSTVVTFGLLLLYNPDYVQPGEAKIAVTGNCVIEGMCVDYAKAMEMFYAGEVDAVVVVAQQNGKTYVRVLLPENDIRAIKAVMTVKKELLKYEDSLRAEKGIPVFDVKTFYGGKDIEVPKGSSTVFEFIYLLLIPLLIITTAVAAAGMTIDSVCEEIQSRTIEVLLSAPVSTYIVSLSKVVAPAVFASLLIPLWLGLMIVNGVEIQSFLAVYVSAVAVVLIFTSAAYAVSVIARDRERSQLIFSIAVAGLLPAAVTKMTSPAILAGRIAAGADFSMGFVVAFFAVAIFLLVSTPFLLRLRV